METSLSIFIAWIFCCTPAAWCGYILCTGKESLFPIFIPSLPFSLGGKDLFPNTIQDKYNKIFLHTISRNFKAIFGWCNYKPPSLIVLYLFKQKLCQSVQHCYREARPGGSWSCMEGLLPHIHWWPVELLALKKSRMLRAWQHSKERRWQRQILETCFSLGTRG